MGGQPQGPGADSNPEAADEGGRAWPGQRTSSLNPEDAGRTGILAVGAAGMCLGQVAEAALDLG